MLIKISPNNPILEGHIFSTLYYLYELIFFCFTSEYEEINILKLF